MEVPTASRPQSDSRRPGSGPPTSAPLRSDPPGRTQPGVTRRWLGLAGGLLLAVGCSPSPREEADRLYQEGLYESAMSLYAPLAEKSSDEVLLRAYGLSLALSGKAAEAEPILKDLPSRSTDPEVAVRYVDCVAILRGGKEAEPILEQVRARWPEHSQVLRAAGTLAAQRGEVEEARRLLKLALERDPKNAEALAALGDLLVVAQDFPGAVQRYQDAVSIRPNSPLSVQLRVKMATLIAEAAPDQSLNLLQEALGLAPENAEVNAELGKVLALIGSCEAAQGHLKKALEGGRSRLDVLSTLGWCSLQQAGQKAGMGLSDRQDLLAAKMWFENLLKKAPTWRGGHTNLGMVLLRLGDLEEAEAAFKEELAHYPASLEALANLGRLMVQNGRGAEARALLTRAFELDRRQVVLASELGSLAMTESDWEAATTWYQKAWMLCQAADRGHPCHVEVPYQLARLAAKGGQKEVATRLFLEAVKGGFRDVARFKAEPELRLIITDSDVAAFLNGTQAGGPAEGR